jgi:transposase-like protein
MGMVIREVCPRCKSATYKKNGHIHNGKQNHQCKDCGRQFVDCFEQYLVSDETRDLIERLLLERLSLRGAIHVRRDRQTSVRYSERVNSSRSSFSHQRTDRYGIVGQEPSHFQRDS